MVLLAVTLAAQVPFDRAISDLASPDGLTRLRAAQMLKDAAYPEAAVPLAKLITDSQDDIQLEAIAAELNIFLAEKIVPRRRVGLIVEKRTLIAAEAIFSSGPLTIGSGAVPMAALDALRTASRDDNPRVRLEAVYAFGVLAVEPGGARRRELLRTSGPDLAAMLAAVDPAHRYAALRVLGRVLQRRLHDDPVDPGIGDAVIDLVNAKEPAMQAAAMQALGAIRDERGVQGLIELFQYHGKGEMAEQALDAIAHIAHPSSATMIAGQLTSKNAALRRMAVEGLARLGDRARAADIQVAVGPDRDRNLQLAASFAGAMLSGAPLDPIVEALTFDRLRDQARGYLIEAAPGRTQMFGRYLQDPDPGVRAACVDALGLSDDSAALTLVQPMAADKDVRVARAVERALARLAQVK